MTRVFLFLACAVSAAAQDVIVDRKALAEFLEKKNLGTLTIDFEHLDSMPPGYFASFSGSKQQLGHLKVFRRIQKDPVTFPEEIHAIAHRVRKGEVFDAAHAAIDREFAAPALPEPEALDGLPEALRDPVGRIVAAVRAKNAAAIVLAIERAAPALLAWKGDVDWKAPGAVVSSSAKPEDPSIPLWIRFGGDDRYAGSWAAGSETRPVSVVIDVGGNDTYDCGEEPGQGAGVKGIGILVDLAGNDAYLSKGYYAQGACETGTGVLIDFAGDDRYVAEGIAQGAGTRGIALLVDRAGRDTYEIAYEGQGYGGPDGFGLLLDLDGDDDYLARDPLYGHAITVPAPQDEKHNVSMAQGAGSGYNQEPFRAGGVGLLLDVRGDDRYRAGCWAQGAGYFLGVGALLDLDGDDSYESWVYVNGTGAHGGFGLQLDARGDDRYKVGGWNGPAMSVDYGIAFFLDGAGNDLYEGASTGHGCSIGLGVSLFQDSGGDDLYQPKQNEFGHGRFYEQEDYNADGKVTPAEKRHWGVFLDLGGSDRYPDAKFGNGKRWDHAEYSGGLDRADAKPAMRAGRARLWNGAEVDVTDANWQDCRPEDLLKLLSGDAKARATYAFEHGFVFEGSALLADVPDGAAIVARFRGPGDYAWEPKAGLWLTPEERAWVPKLKELNFPDDLASWKPDSAWPAWLRRAAARLLQAERDRRIAVPMAKVEAWLARKDVQNVLARKRELEAARAEALAAIDGKQDASAALKKLAKLWADRKAPVVAVDFKDAAKALDRIDPAWRARQPFAAAQSELNSFSLESAALTPEERAARGTPPDLSKLAAGPRSLLVSLNEHRAMLGRPFLIPHDALMKAAGARLKKPDAPLGFEGETAMLTGRSRSAADLLEDWMKDPANRASLASASFTLAGAAVDGNGNWVLIPGRPK